MIQNAMKIRLGGRLIIDGCTHFRFPAIALVLLLFTACIGKSSPTKPTYYYTLDYDSPALTLNHRLPVTLRVERFSVSPPFQSQRIVYAGKGSHRNAYPYHQWIAAPGELLPYLFVRDLRHSEGFKAVLTPDTALAATHSLYGWVEEFLEKDSDPKWEAVATVHVTLINNRSADPSQKIMLQKQYRASSPSSAQTPAALAQAMGISVSKISEAVAKDIHRQLSASGHLNY